MITIHPQVLRRNGKKEFAIIPYQQFLMIQEILEDYDDLRVLRVAKAKEGKAKALPLKIVKKSLRLS